MTLPAEVEGWIGRARYETTANFPVERGYLWSSCASVENGNPLFWDDAVAEELAGGPIAPPTTLSLWMRPHHWEPGARGPRLALQGHFDLKAALDLPEAVISDNVVVFGEPVRPGDLIGTREVVRSISEPKTTKLGTGRFWVVEVEYRNQHGAVVGIESFTGFGYRRGEGTSTAAEAGSPARGSDARLPDQSGTKPPTDAESGEGGELGGDGGGGGGEPAPEPRAGLTLADVEVGQELPSLRYEVTATTVVLGAMASRDWRPMHHDVDFAVNRNGTRDIFLNTPTQQAWFERFVTDWTGPRGRLGRLRFRMHDSVYPHDTMVISGKVDDVSTDDTGCGWVDIALTLHADARLCTTGAIRVAVPTAADDNPWRRRGDQWRPDPDRPLPPGEPPTAAPARATGRRP